MTQPSICVEAYLPDDYTWAWVDISEDVVAGVKATWGIQGSSPKERVADPGTMTFQLDNSSLNSAGALGYYSPGHANAREGFDTGTQVRLVLSHPLFGERVKWLGTILTIRLAGGVLHPTVAITCVDWLEEAQKAKPEGLEVMEDTQADQVFNALLAAIAKQPPATLVISGGDLYPYALDNLRDEDTNLLSELHKLALSEYGYVYMQGGTLVFEGRRRRSGGSSIRLALTDQNVVAVDVAQERDQVWNRVQTKVHPRRVDDDNTTVLFNLGNRPRIERKTSMSLTAPYRDPNQQAQRVAGMDMITPASGTDYAFNTLENGTGLDITSQLTLDVDFGGNSATVEIYNDGPRDGYLTKLQLRGRGLYDFEPVVVNVRDEDSIDDYGENALTIDMPHQASPDIANDAARFILGLYGQPGIRVSSVTIVGWDDAMLQQIFERQISDRVSVTLGELVPETVCFINGIELDVSRAGVLTEKLFLAPANTTRFWRLDEEGQSELDETAILGYGLFVAGWILDGSELGVDTIVN